MGATWYRPDWWLSPAAVEGCITPFFLTNTSHLAGEKTKFKGSQEQYSSYSKSPYGILKKNTLYGSDVPAITGALLSLVTVFFSLVPLLIDCRSMSLPLGSTAGGGPPTGGGGGPGGGGGGGPTIFTPVTECYCETILLRKFTFYIKLHVRIAWKSIMNDSPYEIRIEKDIFNDKRREFPRHSYVSKS